MRPPDTQSRDAIRKALRQQPRSNKDLQHAAHVSPASIKRILQEMGPEILSAGRTRQRRHALRRQVRGTISSLPMYAIDRGGRAKPVSEIEFIHPGACHALLDPLVWPQDDKDGWWEGLPYPLHDMRPQGFLGRAAAREVAAMLGVSANPEDWHDDDVVVYLSTYGADVPGNLVVGQRAIQMWTAQRDGLEVIPARKVAQAYSQRADSAAKLGSGGSSAGGEFPKFTAARELRGADTPHVIVKFSGEGHSGAAQRWADLLVCEQIALDVIAQLPGHASARTRIVQASGRTFLESERFDRHGEHGRSAVATLSAVEASLIGAGPGPWHAVLASPSARTLFRGEAVARVQELWWFGTFIANTDMHHGNLSLLPRGDHFDIAPAYDMLPMHYAPLRGGDVPHREFKVAELPAPPRTMESNWRSVLEAAITFWRKASHDKRISDAFRSICAANVEALRKWADSW